MGVTPSSTLALGAPVVAGDLQPVIVTLQSVGRYLFHIIALECMKEELEAILSIEIFWQTTIIFTSQRKYYNL